MNIHELLKEQITKTVDEGTGIKVTELVAKYMHTCAHSRITDAVEELIQEKKIIGLDYRVPAMDYKVKTILFPAGTTFIINAE